MRADQDRNLWIRLGEMLAVRRAVLDRRYVNLTLFCHERGINYRLAWDIEHGRRDNYGMEKLLEIENAYGLEHGAIVTAFLRGDLTAAPLTSDEERRLTDRAPEAMRKLIEYRKQLSGNGGNAGLAV